MNALLEDLKARGLIAQTTADEELHEHLSSASRTLYCGFDPTADSLHIGSLVPLLILKRFQEAGHKPLALVGGATGLIGDPSFKAAERKLNSDDVVENWVDSIKKQVSAFIEFGEKENAAEVVNNLDWIGKMGSISFLRDVGKHFSVNAMIQKESVKQRIDREGAGISFTEFSYMLLQSYDFAALNKEKACTLQIGGSDQWGNIINGVDLIRRKLQKDSFGLTSPLITLASGAKMGKTEKGAIWLNEELFTPYEYWQFWRNTDDRDVKRFLNFFTEIEISEINDICDNEKNINNLKIILANEVTKILYGETASKKAEKTAKETFQGTGVSQGLPEIQVKLIKIKKGINLLEFLSDNKIMSSKSEARRAIDNKGIKINDVVIVNDKKNLQLSDFKNKTLKLSFGKKKHYLIKII